MPEILEIYDLNSNFLGIQTRKEFYDEIKKEFRETWKISKKVKRVAVILMNSAWRIFLQKRSKTKKENAWMYDKSVAWHVTDSDSYNLSVIKECAEELWFPVSILSSEDFVWAIKSTDLSIVWIFREVDFLENSTSIRVSKDWGIFEQPFMTSIYIWYYDWPIKFVDWESSWIEVFSLEELEDEIKSQSEKFTEDLKFLIRNYGKYLIPIK